MQLFIFLNCQYRYEKIIIFCFLVIISSGCKKNAPTGNVLISIENNTSFTLDSVKLLYDTSNYNYGTIFPNQSTQYVFFKSMPDGNAITADSVGKKIIAGQVIAPNSDLYPVLANGKYTLQIFPDSALFYHYNAKFIKN